MDIIQPLKQWLYVCTHVEVTQKIPSCESTSTEEGLVCNQQIAGPKNTNCENIYSTNFLWKSLTSDCLEPILPPPREILLSKITPQSAGEQSEIVTYSKHSKEGRHGRGWREEREGGKWCNDILNENKMKQTKTPNRMMGRDLRDQHKSENVLWVVALVSPPCRGVCPRMITLQGILWGGQSLEYSAHQDCRWPRFSLRRRMKDDSLETYCNI